LDEPPDPASPWRQRLKWAVYGLLFLDFLLYLQQDIASARHTLHAGSGLLDICAAYVTSIDLVAWFTLILLFELETSGGNGRLGAGPARWAARGVRLVCYVAILHTSFSYDLTLQEARRPVPLPPAQDACAYVGGWSFLRNRDYLEIDGGNCRTIGRGTELFSLGDDAVLTDREGLAEARVLAGTDLAESVTWLLIVFVTEAVVRLSGRARRLALALDRAKIPLYAVILGIAAYWGSKGQLLYLWDELVWVLGFLVIDRNIRDWPILRRRVSVSPSPA
jgi:hypothetical protein